MQMRGGESLVVWIVVPLEANAEPGDAAHTGMREHKEERAICWVPCTVNCEWPISLGNQIRSKFHRRRMATVDTPSNVPDDPL